MHSTGDSGSTKALMQKTTDRFFERAANCILGLNLWAWAVMGLVSSTPQDRWTVVRVCIAALHMMAGSLFVVRRQVFQGGSPSQILSAIPAVVLSGFAFSYARPPSDWTIGPNSMFVIGTAIAIIAFASLAQNFAVLPAVRGVTTGGLYRFVRHPAYFGELLLVVACAISRFDVTSCGILVICVVAIMLRIHAEEKLFVASGSEAYKAYAHDVRYRLVPWVW